MLEGMASGELPEGAERVHIKGYDDVPETPRTLSQVAADLKQGMIRGALQLWKEEQDYAQDLYDEETRLETAKTFAERLESLEKISPDDPEAIQTLLRTWDGIVDLEETLAFIFVAQANDVDLAMVTFAGKVAGG